MDKTLGLSAGRSRVRIPGRGKCSLRTIEVDARVKYPLYLFTAGPSGIRGAKQVTGVGWTVRGKKRVGNKADVTDRFPDICRYCTSVTMSDDIGCDKCPHWFHPIVQCIVLKLSTIECIQDEVCCSCRCKLSNNDCLNFYS